LVPVFVSRELSSKRGSSERGFRGGSELRGERRLEGGGGTTRKPPYGGGELTENREGLERGEKKSSRKGDPRGGRSNFRIIRVTQLEGVQQDQFRRGIISKRGGEE